MLLRLNQARQIWPGPIQRQLRQAALQLKKPHALRPKVSPQAADSLTMRWPLVARRVVLMRLGVALAAITAAAAAAGCATVPSGGAPQKVKGESSQVQAYVRPLPPPPP